MFAVIGASGQTGSAVIQALLKSGAQVRAVLRDAKKADALKKQGADVALADVADEGALAKAFAGVEAAYLMNPPAYMDDDPFARARLVHAAQIGAASRAGVKRIVALSSIGAQHASGTGIILTLHEFEQQLAKFTGDVTSLRACYFMENFAWVLQPILEQGVLPSMLQPLDRKIPMQSVADIGETAARLLRELDKGHRIVELMGPAEYSPANAAAAFGKALGKPVQAVAVPQGEWRGVFAGNGFKSKMIEAFCEMNEATNSGHVAFEGTHTTVRGRVTLEEAVRKLVKH